MQVGDEVEISIAGIGSLTNKVATRLSTRRPSASVWPLAHRLPARRAGPHGPLQLGLRAPPRRHDRVPHRGHRQGAQHPGVLRRDPRPDAAGSASTGTRASRSAAPHGPYRQSERGEIYADVLARLRESSYTYDCFCTTDEVDARRKASGSKVHGVRRLLPRAVRRAAGRLRGRGSHADRAVPDARRLDHVERPGPRRHHLRDRERPRLRALPRQRRPALHAGQPRRRRADGDHPRPARRGPALQHAAPARALRGARRARLREGDPGLRPPALRHGPGQQEALQA